MFNMKKYEIYAYLYLYKEKIWKKLVELLGLKKVY